jgi:hypothetical protein
MLVCCQQRIEVLGIVDHKGGLEELSVCSKHNNPAYRERSGESQEKLKKKMIQLRNKYLRNKKSGFNVCRQ